ncbi:MAG: hypothetical protein AW06_003194 [Candidatus Accumulibacter cognatus]|uniref:Uncharacterized protein n=1 Tax=Candidatus Accumulibacter cognatus TaxID=2954383 RepID=A0A080M366_9PROT|nr:MAG: hypothetical protein AW06_003194 [Candidatus Accumulibacter cognatus]
MLGFVPQPNLRAEGPAPETPTGFFLRDRGPAPPPCGRPARYSSASANLRAEGPAPETPTGFFLRDRGPAPTPAAARRGTPAGRSTVGWAEARSPTPPNPVTPPWNVGLRASAQPTGFPAEGTEEAEARVLERAHALHEGEVSDVAAGMRRSATCQRLAQEARAPVDKCADYLPKKLAA